MTVLFAFLLLAVFAGLCWLMVWDVGRQCDRALHEVDVDALWDAEDERVAA